MRTTHLLDRPHMLLCIAAGLFLVLPYRAFAGDAAKELAIAAKHAGYAANSTNIRDVHMHLHHAVNCLEGPNGPHFDRQELNPCKTLGGGVIPETVDTGRKKMLEIVVREAEKGINSNDLDSARKSAGQTAAMLNAQKR